MLDLSTRIAGAYCTKLMADAGAEVTMVEPPGGSLLRRSTQSHVALPEGEDGCLFSYLAASKTSVIADMAASEDRDVVARLAGSADLVIDTFSPGTLDRLGLGAGALAAEHPAVVLVSITDFGQDGPWADRAASDLTLQAWCGSIGFRGTPERPPIAAGGRIGEYLGGAVAAAAGLAAHRAAALTGIGDHIDVSLLECMTAGFQAFEWLHMALCGLPGMTRSVEFPSIVEVADGWVGFSMVTGQQWIDFTTMVGCPELAEDPELSLMLGRWPRREEVRAAITPWLSSHTVAEVLEAAASFRVPAAPIGNGANLVEIDHFAEREVFVDNPAGFPQPRPPWQIEGVRPRAPERAPRPGEGIRQPFPPAVRGSAGAGSAVPGSAGAGKLDGLRVVDLTAFWAGPSATHVLAALGADVVKVESVQRPDGIRFAGGQVPNADAWWEYGWLFQGVNVDKRGITLDLSRDEGRALAYRLVASADVVIENFSPRVIGHLGLGYDVVAAINPRAIMVRMPAFGLDGPWRDRVGFGPTMEQASGLAWLTGYRDDAPVSPRGPADPLAGYHAVFALMAALALRDRTGRGSLVEVPMVEVALSTTADQVAEYVRYGELLTRDGNRGPDAAPQNVYATAGTERWIALSVVNDQQWAALRSVIGDPEWARDPLLMSGDGRRRAHDLLDQRLGEWLVLEELDDVVERLLSAGVPAAPVVSPPDVVENPHLLERRFFQELVHPVTGRCLVTRPPFRFAAGGPECRRPAPTLGQHNDEVLGGELGLSPAELSALREQAIIGDTPAGL